MAIENKDVLDNTLRDYHNLTPDVQAQLMDDFLEEQPFLTGFLYNLTDDFGEDQFEALITSALILEKSFKQVGLTVAQVEQDLLTRVIEEKVSAYEALAEGDTPIEFSMLLEVSSSPMVTSGLLQYILARTGEEDLDPDLFLVVDVVITAMEQSVAPETKEDEV